MPIPTLTQGVTFAIAANASEHVRVLPFRMTERAFVRMRFASVCSPDLLTTRPPRYSVQELDECQRLGIEPDPSAGSRIRPFFQVKVLNSWGRVLEPLWADFSQPPGVIKLQLHIGPEEPAQNHEELAVILPEGQYALLVKPSFYSGDMREDRQSGPWSMTVTVAEFKSEPLPPTTQALAAWLDATSLNEHFSVIDFYAANPPGTASCAARRDRRYQSVLFAVAKDRQVLSDGRASEERTNKKDIKLVRNLCDPRAKPVRVARPDVPTVLVHLSTTLHDGELGALEKHFYQRFGATLWDRMFLKISSSLRLPQKQIAMQVPPAVCWDGLIYWSNGSAGRSRDRCSYATSAGVSIPLSDLNLNLNLPNLANTAQSSIATGIQRIGQIIATFIENSYTTKGATVEFLERDNSSVEAIVRGLRGEVIRGGKDWERMQVSVFALRGEKGTIQLRTLVDGRIASGLGRYPPDSIFTTDMEPRYSGAMTEYARRLLDGIQAELTRRGPSK